MSRIRPLVFSDFLERLDGMSIMADLTRSGKTRMLREYRMGVGTDHFYAVPYDGDNALIYPPTILKVLEHFGISMNEWERGEAGGDVLGRVTG